MKSIPSSSPPNKLPKQVPKLRTAATGAALPSTSKLKRQNRGPQRLTSLFRVLCLIAIVIGLCIGSYLCLRPSSNLRDIPWLPASLTRWADYHGRIRNFPAFATLALPFMFVCNGRRARRKAIAGLSAFVIVTELAQHFIPGRWCEWQDIVSGCGGLFATWLLFEGALRMAWRIRCVLKRRKINGSRPITAQLRQKAVHPSTSHKRDSR